MKTFFTDGEIEYLKTPEVSLRWAQRYDNLPFVITNVRQTQLSIARHYGGIKYNGAQYVYHPPTDELIREDVLKFITKYRKKSKTKQEDNG